MRTNDGSKWRGRGAAARSSAAVSAAAVAAVTGLLLGACAKAPVERAAPDAAQEEGAAMTAKGATPGSTAAFALPAGATAIGQPITQPAPMKLAALQADVAPHLARTVLVEATAEAICQAKGCWMTVKDGEGAPIWVRWSSGCGGEFAFPKDAAGRRVLVEGTLSEKEISAEDAEHLAEESLGLDAAKIAGKTFEIDATACVVLPEISAAAS